MFSKRQQEWKIKSNARERERTKGRERHRKSHYLWRTKMSTRCSTMDLSSNKLLFQPIYVYWVGMNYHLFALIDFIWSWSIFLPVMCHFWVKVQICCLIFKVMWQFMSSAELFSHCFCALLVNSVMIYLPVAANWPWFLRKTHTPLLLAQLIKSRKSFVVTFHSSATKSKKTRWI